MIKLVTDLDKDKKLTDEETKAAKRGWNEMKDHVINDDSSMEDQISFYSNWVSTYVTSPAGGKSGSSLSKDDFMTMSKVLGISNNVDLDKVFTSFDKNGDGEITFDEQVKFFNDEFTKMM